MKTVIYARVSTSAQEYDRQISDLTDYANRMNYTICKVFAEKVSGAAKKESREDFMQMIDYVTTHEIDKVLIYECSRISRRVVDFLSTVEVLTENGVSLYIHQSNLETLNPDGSINPISQMVLGIMSQFNTMERGLIRSRMESGYRNYRSSGGRVGRREGYRKPLEQMKDQYSKEIQLLRKGISYRNIYAITGTSVNTLRKVKSLI